MTERSSNPVQFNQLTPAQKAQVCFQRAVQLQKENKLDEAINFYGQSIAYYPDNADAYNNMAVALRKGAHFEAALASYQRALSLRPDHAGTYSNIGNVLADLDRSEEAITAHNKAVELDPESLLYLYNRALVLRDSTRLEEALLDFDTVLGLDSNYGDCQWDRALTYLMAGDFKRGFEEYDARWQLEKSPPRPFSQPRWSGDALGQRTLFIHREQGFGDAIQFARLIPSIKKRFGGRVILECQPDLMALFANIEGVDQLVSYGSPPPAFDTWIPLMSLAHLLLIQVDNIPGATPYLKAPPEQRFNVRAAPEKGANIGIVWAGSPTHRNDRRRSTQLKEFLPLAARPGVTLFSLQKGPRAQDLTHTGARGLVIDAGKDIRHFSDTADLINQLDLVITVDTSVAHLAGALGKEVWVLLPFTPDWRWMLDRDDSPWYPDMTLFRQSRAGDWSELFQRVYSALDHRLQGK